MQARSLDTEAQFLKGVGPRFAPALAKLGLNTVGDVLYHLPRRYKDRRHLPPIRQIQAGQWATVKGRLVNLETRPTRGGKVLLKASINDGTGTLILTWFNQPWIKRQLQEHKGEIVAYGLAKEANYLCEMNGPEYELLGEEAEPDDFAQ